MEITALGDLAWRLTVGTEIGEAVLARVMQVAGAIEAANLNGVREIVAAYTSVVVHLTADASAPAVREEIQRLLARTEFAAGKVVGAAAPVKEIAVAYGGEFGPDLAELAEASGISPDEVVARHTAAEYRVHAVGFAPGFPYLAGLDPCLHRARRANPRIKVPAGSVGIGGGQTGIYPITGPGGWNLIGRTNRVLFDPVARPPAWLQVGDRVRFTAVPRGEFKVTAIPTGAEHIESGELEILHPGLGCSVQDTGRWGWQGHGVSVGGAADSGALAVANLAVGNAPDEAVLEWTLRGPRLLFHAEREVVVTGAMVKGVINGQPRRMQAGEVLDLSGSLVAGCRGYVAIGGGLDLAEVLGSRSTDTRAGFGGWQGRRLRAGDRLPLNALATGRPSAGGWRVSPTLSRSGQPMNVEVAVRVMVGPEGAQFSAVAWKVLLDAVFVVSPRSDRMGVRLQGGRLAAPEAGKLISAPVTVGAVQVPPDGKPIILLADRQTIGGYPQIAYVISVDVAKVAQAAPGARLRFVRVTADEAEARRRQGRRALAQLALGVERARSGRR